MIFAGQVLPTGQVLAVSGTRKTEKNDFNGFGLDLDLDSSMSTSNVENPVAQCPSSIEVEMKLCLQPATVQIPYQLSFPRDKDEQCLFAQRLS